MTDVVAAVEPDVQQTETLIQEIERRYRWPSTYEQPKQVGEIRIRGSRYRIRIVSLAGAFGDPSMQVQLIQDQPDRSQTQLFVYLNLSFGTRKNMLSVVRQRYDKHERKLVREFEDRYEIQTGTWQETLRVIAKTLHDHRSDIFSDDIVNAAAEPESACFLVQEIRRHQHRTATVKLFGLEFAVHFVYNSEADRAAIVLYAKGGVIDVEITIDVNNHPTVQAVSAFFVTRVAGSTHHRSVDLDVLEKQASTWGLNEFLGYVVQYLNAHRQQLEHEHLIMLPHQATAAVEPEQSKDSDHAFQDLVRKTPETELVTLHGLNRAKKMNALGMQVRVAHTKSPVVLVYVSIRHDDSEPWSEARVYNEHDGNVMVRMVLRFDRRVIERSLVITGCDTGAELLQEVVKHLRAELQGYTRVYTQAATEPRTDNEEGDDKPSFYVLMDEIECPRDLQNRLHYGFDVRDGAWNIRVRAAEFGSLEFTASNPPHWLVFRAKARHINGKNTVTLTHVGTKPKQVLRFRLVPGLTAENLIRILLSAIQKYVTDNYTAAAAAEPGLPGAGDDVIQRIADAITFQPSHKMQVSLPGLEHAVELRAGRDHINVVFKERASEPDQIKMEFYRSMKVWKGSVVFWNGARHAFLVKPIQDLMLGTGSRFQNSRHLEFFAAAAWRLVQAMRTPNAVAATEPGLGNISPTYQKFYKLAYADFKKPLATKRIRGYEISIHAHDDKESLDPDNLLFYVSTPATPEYTQMFTTDLFDIAKARIQITLKHELRVEVIPVDDNVDSGSARSHTTFPLDAPVQPVLRFIFDTVGKYNIRERVYNAE
jgi:hypothetical protein